MTHTLVSELLQVLEALPQAPGALSQAPGALERAGALQAHDVAVDAAIRSRRTHKVFAADPIDQETVLQILDLARWAPNHKLTNPWRFRVLGSQARAALELVADADKPGSGAKLHRAPTLICATVLEDGDEARCQEDMLAAAAACYIVLLAADARGLASYWRTVSVIETEAGRAALSIPAQERVLGLLHLGYRRQEQRVPERDAVESVVTFLP